MEVGQRALALVQLLECGVAVLVDGVQQVVRRAHRRGAEVRVARALRSAHSRLGRRVACHAAQLEQRRRPCGATGARRAHAISPASASKRVHTRISFNVHTVPWFFHAHATW